MIKTILLAYSLISLLFLIYSFLRSTTPSRLASASMYKLSNVSAPFYGASSFYGAEEVDDDTAENKFNREIEELGKSLSQTRKRLQTCTTNKNRLNAGIDKLRTQIKDNVQSNVNTELKHLETCEALQSSRITKYKNAYKKIYNKDITDSEVGNLIVNNRL